MAEQRGESNWDGLPEAFSIFSAARLCEMTSFERYQDLDRESAWIEGQPAVVLFVSHRWDAPTHPDPSGRQLDALQALLTQTATVLRASFSERTERLALVPDIGLEGVLQAQELARRFLGHGPFSSSTGDPRAFRELIASKASSLDPEAFDRWLLSRIGLWLDYCSVPQEPRNAEEQKQFERTLLRLDELLRTATVLALRRTGDDYAERSWCTTEIWLGARRSFAQSLFLHMDRASEGRGVEIPDPPAATGFAAEILTEGYDADREAFDTAVADWRQVPTPLESTPPDAWSAYRSLQGSATFPVEEDPNPGRRAVEWVRGITTELIRRWWWSDHTVTVDLQDLVDGLAERLGLHSTTPSDRIYLGLLLSSQGWIEALRPLFQAAMVTFLDTREPLVLTLEPLSSEVRAALESVRPDSPDTWFSRLAQRTGHGRDEQRAIEAVRDGLRQQPLTWRLSASA